MSPNEFVNDTNGIYVIHVAQLVPLCDWDSGDYDYVVRINVSPGGATFRGSGLGKLTIP